MKAGAIVFDAVVHKSAIAHNSKTNGNLADLKSVHRMITSPVLMATFGQPGIRFSLQEFLSSTFSLVILR